MPRRNKSKSRRKSKRELTTGVVTGIVLGSILAFSLSGHAMFRRRIQQLDKDLHHSSDPPNEATWIRDGDGNIITWMD